MLKIAVIGGRETVTGFIALGLETYPVSGADEARTAFRKLTRQGADEYAIIYIEEKLAEALEADIAKYGDTPTPAVIVIPGRDGSTGFALGALKAAVERAVGSDIL